MYASADNYAEGVILVQDNYGIHARPAASLAKTAQRFAARVTLIWQEQEVDAKSILDILSLAAPPNAELKLVCKGPDAAEACRAMQDIF